jgi:hypothetical protein
LGSLVSNSQQETTNMNTAISLAPSIDTFETIDSNLLAAVGGGEGQPANDNPNFLQRWGRNMQSGGEYAMAAGAVGTVVPGLGETGIPEGVAAGGGASWLLGKGIEGVGSLFR